MDLDANLTIESLSVSVPDASLTINSVSGSEYQCDQLLLVLPISNRLSIVIKYETGNGFS
jgi:hypothetical protein